MNSPVKPLILGIDEDQDTPRLKGAETFMAEIEKYL